MWLFLAHQIYPFSDYKTEWNKYVFQYVYKLCGFVKHTSFIQHIPFNFHYKLIPLFFPNTLFEIYSVV